MSTLPIFPCMLIFLASLAGEPAIQENAVKASLLSLEKDVQQKQTELVTAMEKLVAAYRPLACKTWKPAWKPNEAEELRRGADAWMKAIAAFSLEDYAKRKDLPPLTSKDFLPLFYKEREAYVKKDVLKPWQDSPYILRDRIYLVEMDRPLDANVFPSPRSLEIKDCLELALGQDYLGQYLQNPAQKLRRLQRARGYYLQFLAMATRRAGALAQWEKSDRKQVRLIRYYKEYTPDYDIAGDEVWRGHWREHYLVARDGSIRRATPANSAPVVAKLKPRWRGESDITWFLEKVLEADAPWHQIIRTAGDIPGYTDNPAKKEVEESIRPIKGEKFGNGAVEYTLYTYEQPGGHVVQWKLKFKEGKFMSIVSKKLAFNIGEAAFLQ